jgi:outer membrane protein OmpA-like peptidoglycan-associated protein
MKFNSTLAILFSGAQAMAQQVNTGLVMDNYFSSNSVTFNPSTIVDSKSRLAISTGINFTRHSNFYKNDYFGNEGKLVDGKKKGYQNSEFTSDNLYIKYELDHKNALAYTFRTRTFNNQRGIPGLWNESAALLYAGNDTTTVFDVTGFSLAQMDYNEHVFTYARTIFDRGERFLKVGASLKILNGINARYMYFESGTMKFMFEDAPMVDVNDLSVDYGENVSDAQLKYKNRGIGFDFGATYEYRPNHERQYYDMDGEKRIVRHDMNKYKMKFGASITDLGSIKFMEDTTFGNLSGYSGIQNSAGDFYDVGGDFFGLGGSPYTVVQNTVKPFSTIADDPKDFFRMTLPTTLHVNVDYLIENFRFFKNDLYVSYNMSLPLIGNWDRTRVNQVFIHTVTPRIEKEKYSILIPLSQMGTGRAYFGLAGRFNWKTLSVFGGSNNLAVMFGQKASLTRSFFFGLSYNVLYDIPSDKDFDKVSDDRDECPSDPGLWELQGCPDTDGDGIPDKEDYCIYEQGPRTTRGCPDTDGDGIIDMNDMCPDVKGLGVHYGCPDRDFDGVIDMADKCPDLPGIELNNGCPFENPGCCMDNDGDGVSNNADKCPDHAGSVYNDGCPIDESNINKIKLQEEKAKLDANHTGEQIKVLANNDTIRNLITSKEQLNKIVASKKVMKEHSIFFDVDQAMVNETEQKAFDKFLADYKKDETVTFMVIGNTDRDGTLEYNLILSKKRAETIKRKLIDAGFAEDSIEVYYYGEGKSLHKGSYTAEQKRMDRRVDIKIIKGDKK